MGVRTVVVALSALAVACAPTDHSVVLRELRSQFAQQFHECVPLGWNIVPLHGFAIPGTFVEVSEYGNGRIWLPAMWLARVDARRLQRADVRATAELLDALTRVGMLGRQRGPHASLYYLTNAALPYFFADSGRGNDPDALSYLCYSAIVPERVLWTQPVHVEASTKGDERVFRAGFAWRGGPIAEWARDPFIRSHSVVLTPTRSPAVAKFVQHGRTWSLVTIYSAEPPLPVVVDASAWPPAPAGPRS